MKSKLFSNARRKSSQAWADKQKKKKFDDDNRKRAEDAAVRRPWRLANKQAGRIVCALLTVAFLLGVLAAPAVSAQYSGYIQVTGYDPNVDYSRLMNAALADGSTFAMQMGAIYEQQRNMKIDGMGLKYEKSYYFQKYDTAAEILEARYWDSRWYTADDLDLLSRLVTQEMGCEWMPDWVQQLTASVVINRLKSPNYPGTFQEVIYQPGQYGPAITGTINRPAIEKVKANCRYALDNWPLFPENVLSQDENIWGEIYKSYTDPVLGTTTYFCYR